jgi:hypothetical protein
MALIIDPDDLNQGVEITIDTTTKEITLTVAGNLSDDGVTGQAFYSFLKEEWNQDPLLIAFDFPMVPVTPEQFEFVQSWKLIDDTSRNLLRSAGWREIATSGVLNREYIGVISLGSIDPADTAYYAFASQTSKSDFAFSGVINQGVQTYGDAANGNFDYRSELLTLFIRTQGKLYGTQTTTDIGVSELSYIAYRFPLSESTDLKVIGAGFSDTTIQNNAPYTGMGIQYGAVVRNIGGVNYNFSIVINGNNATAEQIYAFVQYRLRQDADIDDGAGSENGLLTESLLAFIGDGLSTLLTADGGVFIDNFNSNDTNRISFIDDSGISRTSPFVAAGTISTNANLQVDASAIYRMFFTSNPAGNFGTSSAVLVDDNSGNNISGGVSGSASIPFTFDYDGNVQGGRSAGTDADVTVVAIGLNSAQYVVAIGVITRATGLSLSLVAPLERNYSNPV